MVANMSFISVLGINRAPFISNQSSKASQTPMLTITRPSGTGVQYAALSSAKANTQISGVNNLQTKCQLII
jgi:hypothetical protein